MRLLLIYISLLLFSSGCKKGAYPDLEVPSEEMGAVDLFRKTLKTKDKIVFYSDRRGPCDYGSCKLELGKHSSVLLRTAGINFGSYSGIYHFKNTSIEFTFPASQRVLVPGYTKFPTLTLTEKNGILILNRKDGITHLDEEGNIWPDSIGDTTPVFPLKTRPKQNAEQDAAGNPLPAV